MSLLLDELFREAEEGGFILFSLYESFDTRPLSARAVGSELLRRWNVSLKCPHSGLYGFGSADTREEAFRLALDEARLKDRWTPQFQDLTQQRPGGLVRVKPTLDDVLSHL